MPLLSIGGPFGSWGKWDQRPEAVTNRLLRDFPAHGIDLPQEPGKSQSKSDSVAVTDGYAQIPLLPSPRSILKDGFKGDLISHPT